MFARVGPVIAWLFFQILVFEGIERCTLSMEGLVRAFGYKKFKRQPRVLVFKLKYPLVDDIIENALHMGWSVSTVSAQMSGQGSGGFVERLLTTALEHKPDFILTLNHGGFDEDGALAGILASLEIPLASWFVDHPLPILGGATVNATDWCKVFCFERTAIPWLEENGFHESSYLPTAANGLRFDPGLVDSSRRPDLGGKLVFVGNSWWTKIHVDPPKWVRDAVEKVVGSGELSRELLADGKLISTIDQIVGDIGGPRGAYLVAQASLAHLSMLARQRVVQALFELGLKVHGDPNWEELVPGLPLLPYVDYATELPIVFARSQVNLNITAEQMPTAVNQRVWDVPACGGFLLTDFRRDVCEHFDAWEDFTYSSPEEAADKVRYFAGNEDARKVLSESTMKTVRTGHLLEHRLETMWEEMKRRFG